MSKFGISNPEAQSFSEANFMSAVVSVAKSLKADGVTANDDAGKAVMRMESSNAGLRASIASSSQAYAQAIAASLDFSGVFNEEEPGNMANKMKLRQEAFADRAMKNATLGYAMAVGARSLEGRQLARASMGADTVLMGSTGNSGTLRLRQEAFRNIDLHRTVAFTMGYNAAMTRHTDTVMAWFPPIFINPDQVGLDIKLNMLVVYDGAHHDISGAKTEFNRVNVVRGFADPSILGRHETQVVPVYRPENASKFVDATVFTPYEKQLSRTRTLTSYLKFDQDVSLIGIAQTDALLKTGEADQRDVLEPGVKLESILIKSGDDIIKLPVVGLKGSVFVGAQQHDQQEVLLNMRTNIALGKNLKRHDGSALTGPLKALVDNDLRLKLHLNVYGSVNVETTNAKVNKPSLAVQQLVDAGTQEPITAGATLAALKTAISDIEFLGFEQRSFRTNANRRQVGQRLNTRTFNFHFPVLYRDPITVERPVHMGEEADAQDLTNLQSMVRMRIEAEVIDKIVEVSETSATFVDMRDYDAEATDMEGLAHFYLKRAYHRETLHMPAYVDSLKSADRAKDIQAAFVVKLRDIAARLYTTTEFKAGSDWFSGGTLPAPQVNVLTDPIIARYIMEPGELRTLGDFEMVLTSTLNNRVRGQIFMSFRMPGQEASNEPCIFNFGHLLTSTELVLAANMTRNGSYFAETQLAPRYELAVMNPTMAHFTVTGLPEVLSKVPVATKFTQPLRIDGIVETHVNP